MRGEIVQQRTESTNAFAPGSRRAESEAIQAFRAEPPELTDEQRDGYVAAIEVNQSLGNKRALATVGVDVSSAGVRALFALEPELEERVLEARGRAPEQIRAEIRRRAIDGWEEPVFHNGEPVGSIRKFDGRLLQMMAKANLPEYRDSTTLEVGGVGGGPVRVEQRGVSLVAVAAVLQAAGALPSGGDGAGDAGEDVPAVGQILAEPVPEV